MLGLEYNRLPARKRPFIVRLRLLSVAGEKLPFSVLWPDGLHRLWSLLYLCLSRKAVVLAGGFEYALPFLPGGPAAHPHQNGFFMPFPFHNHTSPISAAN